MADVGERRDPAQAHQGRGSRNRHPHRNGRRNVKSNDDGNNVGRGHHRGHGRGRGRGDRSGGRTGPRSPSAGHLGPATFPPTSKLLILHGNRQTGELLLSRMSSLKKKLLKPRESDSQGVRRVELIAPDAPFLWETVDGKPGDEVANDADETNLRTWWHRSGNEYGGLDTTLDALHRTWIGCDDGFGFDGVLGFSQGARLAHLLALLHAASAGSLFPGLKFVILASGYGDVPLPTNFPPRGAPWDHALSRTDGGELDDVRIVTPSLHVMGVDDRIVPICKSRALLDRYMNPKVHEHKGGHHVPMRANDVLTYLEFIDNSLVSAACSEDDRLTANISVAGHQASASAVSQGKDRLIDTDPKHPVKNVSTAMQHRATEDMAREPDEEHAQVQVDECESLSLIFPEEFKLLSKTREGEDTDEFGSEHKRYAHPIRFAINLRPPEDQIADEALWPRGEISLQVQYPPDYPDVSPEFSLRHEMNLLKFKVGQSKACLDAVRKAAEAEAGMPCVMGCVYAAREFFENGGLASSVAASAEGQATSNPTEVSRAVGKGRADRAELTSQMECTSSGGLTSSTQERIQDCNKQGLEVATSILGHPRSEKELSSWLKQEAAYLDSDSSNTKGGSWKYTIGLVGKPSAGKSTFFNAATAFAKQRGGADSDGSFIGGATMAPHPFTTIDPNVGYCLVPAPHGSCPEDDSRGKTHDLIVGSTHGRDPLNRRLLPVMLKDVAGLVPGAYQGRGKGNKFLDDLTDADVLVHVVDASGSADAEGNTIRVDDDGTNDEGNATTHPLDDLAWVRNELVEWVYFNLSTKWDGVKRRGRDKLATMFSGYKQSQAFVWDVLLNVEKYMERREGRSHALDHLGTWSEADLHRLVSAFLGVRFPMALALNKSDLPTAAAYVRDVREALPVHGAHVGVPLSARREMSFVRRHMAGGGELASDSEDSEGSESAPKGVWDCLQSAMQLREPVLVFPVTDITTYEPLPGMADYAVGHSSLPSGRMISCLESCGGIAPSLWDGGRRMYTTEGKKSTSLRDVILMRPGSSVEDVFLALKKMGALSGDFVRAEGAGNIGDKPKLVKKDDRVGKHNRILKIMTNRKR